MRRRVLFLALALTATLGALLTAPTQAASGCYQTCFEQEDGSLCCTTCCKTAGGVVCTNLGCP